MSRWTLAVILALAGCEGGGEDRDGGPRVDAANARDGGTGDGTDGGATGDPDAAATEDGGAPTCATGRVRIEESCEPELAPCGGEVVGEHCYSDVCLEKDELIAEALMQPGVPDGCTADGVEVRGSIGMIDGTITFTDTQVTRRVTSTVTGTFWLPPECQIVAGECAVTEALLNGALAPDGTAACGPDAGGCECDVVFEWRIDDSNPYTIEGNTIVTGSGRRFDYCVEGEDGLRFREDAASGGEPGIQTVRPSGA